MEKTNSFKTDGVFDETTQMTTKWLTDACSSMTNIYDKQLKTALSFYNNFFNSFSGSNGQGQNNGSFPSFFAGNEFFKSAFNPMNFFRLNTSPADFFTSQYEEMSKQMRELNARAFSLFQEDFKNRQSNWTEFNKLMEEEWKATQDIANSFRETYKKQLTQTMELNKKWLEEMNDQFEMATDRNKKFWSDLTEQAELHKNGKETEPEQRESQTKKQERAEYANNSH